MNFKKFIKRVNRGLFLGILLIVGLVSYVVADSIEFKRNKPEMKQFLEQYYQDIDSCISTDDIKGQKAVNDLISKYDTLINNYWVQTEPNIYNYFSSKSAVIDLAKSYEEGNSDIGQIKEWNYSLSQVKVTKTGPGTADIKYNYSVMTEFTGKAVLTPASSGLRRTDEMTGYGGYETDYNIDGNADEETKTENMGNKNSAKMIYNMSGSETLKLKKVNGEWKIYGSSNSIMNSNVREAEGDE